MRRHDTSPQQTGGASLATMGLMPQAIESSMVILPGPRYRAVLETSALSVTMLSEEAAGALEATYHRFLAGLDFPLQIVVRTQVAHAAPYLARLRGCLTRETEPALVRLLLAQASHLERLIATHAPLERHFYVIVPAPNALPSLPHRRPWQRAHTSGASESSQAAATQALGARCQAVAAGLRAVGLQVHRLGTADMAALWHECLCPHTARRQPLAAGAVIDTDLPILTWPKGGAHHALVSA